MAQPPFLGVYDNPATRLSGRQMLRGATAPMPPNTAQALSGLPPLPPTPPVATTRYQLCRWAHEDACFGETPSMADLAVSAIGSSAAGTNSQKGIITFWVNPIGIRDDFTVHQCGENFISFQDPATNDGFFRSLGIFLSNLDSGGRVMNKIRITLDFEDIFGADGTYIQNFTLGAGSFFDASTWPALPAGGFALGFQWDFTTANWTAAITMNGVRVDNTFSTKFFTGSDSGPETDINVWSAGSYPIGTPLSSTLRLFDGVNAAGQARVFYFDGGTDQSSNQVFPPASPMVFADMWENAEWSQAYFAPSQWLDLTNPANFAKFFDSAASYAPIGLGTSGATPTGSAPLIYLNGDVTNFETNRGSMGTTLTRICVTTALDGVTCTAPASATTIPAAGTYQAIGIHYGRNNGAGELLPAGDAATIVCGLPAFMEGETVVGQQGALSVGSAVVSGGCVQFPGGTAGSVTVGLGYCAQFKSTKLAYAAQLGTALIQQKRVSQLGFILRCLIPRGLSYGKDFDHLDPLPAIYKGAVIDATALLQEWDALAVPFHGDWDTDARLCIQACSPFPMTVLAAIFSLDLGEKR